LLNLDMSLRSTDAFLISHKALSYIEQKEQAEGLPLAKIEVIEYFFEWLREQPLKFQVSFLRKALSDE